MQTLLVESTRQGKDNNNNQKKKKKRKTIRYMEEQFRVKCMGIPMHAGAGPPVSG